ncbi:MAG TPA: hypothetical protein VFT71_02015 [Candidatus Nitrosocosmicus sp.]|nr:hypothetical protein [Candidatus Nitrosocosmicus sp.]
MTCDKGIPHSYQKIGNEYGSLLIMLVTQRFKNFFRDLNLQIKIKKTG